MRLCPMKQFRCDSTARPARPSSTGTLQAFENKETCLGNEIGDGITAPITDWKQFYDGKCVSNSKILSGLKAGGSIQLSPIPTLDDLPSCVHYSLAPGTLPHRGPPPPSKN